MKKISLWALAVLLIAVVGIPGALYESKPRVLVTWSVSEKVPVNHVITLSGNEFQILAGQETTKEHRLNGGGFNCMIYDSRGWGLPGQTIQLDGQQIPLDRIRLSKRSGTLRILGIGRQPTMHAEIQM